MRFLAGAVSVLSLLGSIACGSHHSGGDTPAPQPAPVAAPTQQPAPAPAGPVSPSPVTPDAHLNYLSPTAIDVPNAIPAPAADQSTEDLAELQSMMQMQASRTTQDCARANTEVTVGLEAFYGPAYGPLSEAEVKRFSGILGKVQSDTQYFVSKEKSLWNRSRPYDDSSDIQPCLPLESSSSYPSGHATISKVMADVLDLISPARKSAFEARASQIAQDRVMGGVHRPTDIQEGRVLADEIFAQMLQNPDFQADLNSLKASANP